MDRQEYRRRLAAKLRGARAESGRTQVEVRDATGISTAHLSRVENAQESLDLEELLLLAALYDVPLERFLEVVGPLGEPPTATRALSNGERQRQAA